MLARRFLWVIVGLVMLTFTAALAYRMFGQQIMRSAMVPSVSFANDTRDPTPDYHSARMWLARPDLADDPSRWTPKGHKAAQAPQAAAFYVAPTTYMLRSHWNVPLDDRDADERARYFTKTQASVLNGVAAIWAPRYRQATFGAFLTDKPDAVKALDLAYHDVAAAFDSFVGAIPSSQPIILAGHSQGSLHLMRLLKEKVAGTLLAKRVVAVYLAGWPVSVEADIPAMGLPACEKAGQPGCLISWQSFAEPADTSLMRETFDAESGLTGKPRRGTEILCVNPLTGMRGGKADAQANLGALRQGEDMLSLWLEPGKIGARCDEGVVLIGSPPAAFAGFMLPGNNFHVYDYALFWANLRADVEARTAAYLAAKP